jgi:hypothetical protein
MSGLQTFTTIALLATTLMPVPEAKLTPEAVAGWDRYVRSVEARIAAELQSADRFLAADFEDEGLSVRREALAGAIPTGAVDAPGADVPSARIHHWRGTVFVPGASLDRIMRDLQTTPPEPDQQEDVLASRMLETGLDYAKVFLKLRRRKIVTAVFNTEHHVTFDRMAPGRATTVSVATRIAEVRDAGTPDARELPPGEDRGFLWRLNAYWRYEEVPGGVMAECESISLSRDVPAVVRFMAAPLISGAARESLERTLDAFRRRFATSAPPGTRPRSAAKPSGRQSS